MIVPHDRDSLSLAASQQVVDAYEAATYPRPGINQCQLQARVQVIINHAMEDYCTLGGCASRREESWANLAEHERQRANDMTRQVAQLYQELRAMGRSQEELREIMDRNKHITPVGEL